MNVGSAPKPNDPSLRLRDASPVHQTRRSVDATDHGPRTTDKPPMLRFLWLVGFSLWTGGFVFYASFVVPILRRELGESAIITKHVAPIINWIGLIVLTVWSLELFFDWPRPKGWRAAFVLLVANAISL